MYNLKWNFVTTQGRNRDAGVSVRVGIILDGERTAWTSPSLNFLSRAMDIINSRQDLPPGVTLSYGPIFFGNSTFK